MAETIGDRIKLWRRARKISADALASAAGIARSTLGDLEANRSTSTTKLHLIAQKLRISVNYLETGRGDAETGVVAAPVDDSWPFSFARSRFDRLTDREKQAIDASLAAYVSHCEVSREKRAIKRQRAG